jgi:hypothetical protein
VHSNNLRKKEHSTSKMSEEYCENEEEKKEKLEVRVHCTCTTIQNFTCIKIERRCSFHVTQHFLHVLFATQRKQICEEREKNEIELRERERERERKSST